MSGSSPERSTRTARSLVIDGSAIAAGDHAELRALRELAASEGRRLLVFGARSRPPADGTWRSWHIGQESALDSAGLDHALAMSRRLREQLRRARAKGVTVRTWTEDDSAVPGSLPGLDALIDAWLRTRALPPMRFLLALDDVLENGRPRSSQTWFVAERSAVPCGFAVARPDPTTNGHTLEHLVRAPAAPNGIVELLIAAAIRSLAAAGSQELSLGLSPLSGVRSRILRGIARVSRPAFDFEGLANFKRKFQPRIQRPNWVWFSSHDSRPSAVLEVLRAFAGGSLVRFAVRSLVR